MSSRFVAEKSRPSTEATSSTARAGVDKRPRCSSRTLPRSLRKSSVVRDRRPSLSASATNSGCPSVQRKSSAASCAASAPWAVVSRIHAATSSRLSRSSRRSSASRVSLASSGAVLGCKRTSASRWAPSTKMREPRSCLANRRSSKSEGASAACRSSSTRARGDAHAFFFRARTAESNAAKRASLAPAAKSGRAPKKGSSSIPSSRNT